MPKRIFIRDGGLTASRPIPNGYVAIGTDSGIPRKQILSIISEFTGAVTGNGTTNYVPKWNSVTGLSSTSSIYIDGDGNIGIGYTSQANTSLLIRGKGDFFGNKAIKVSSTGLGDIFTVEDYVPRVTIGASYTTIPATITLGNNTATQNFIGFGNNSELGWLGSQTNAGLRMQFTDKVNNQTDIFLSSDPATLTYGNSYVSAAFRYNVLIGTPAGFNPGNPYPSNSPVRLWVKGMGTSSATYSLKVDDGADNPLLHVRDDGYFDAGNGNLIAYDNGSNIFIGANSNKYRGLNIGPYNTPFVYFDIQNSITTIYNGTIIGGSSSGLVGNTARVKISGDGSIGLRNIGFQYNGNNGFTDYAIGNESDGLNTTIRLSFNPTQFGYGVAIGLDANNSWRIGIGTSSVSSHRVVISDGLKLISTPYNSNSFEIQTSSGTPSFIVQNNGNVGIGTTNPNYKLDVKGNVRIISTSSTTFQVGSSDLNIHLSYDGNGTTSMYMLSSQNLSTGADNVTRINGSYLQIQNGAFISSYQQPLTLWRIWPQLGNAEGFIIDNDMSGGGVASPTYKILHIKSDGVTRSYLTPTTGYFSQNIGIGTASPNYTLDVTGDINTSTLYRVGATAGWTGTFSADGQIVSVIGGIITSVV